MLKIMAVMPIYKQKGDNQNGDNRSKKMGELKQQKDKKLQNSSGKEFYLYM